LPIHGRHQARNVAAAACVVWHLDRALEFPRLAPGERLLTDGRGDRHALPGGGVLIDDAYNANPESMRAGLEELEALAGHRRVAVLGYMAELGDELEADAHRQLGVDAAESGVELLVVVTAGRPNAAAIAAGYTAAGGTATVTFDDLATASAVLPSLLEPSDAVLVKASNSVGLGRLAAELVESLRSGTPTEERAIT
jgi:UDP-N-acetylmuramoyl-tripeptide--D-alanyl-D-alanine ligase